MTAGVTSVWLLRLKKATVGVLAGLIAHSNEQYGYLSVYLRLKGIVPPSTENM